MAGWPNIVVTKSDSPQVVLAVEVKVGAAGAPDAEAGIKAYMIRQSCPIGMLVTADQALFYRNRYTGWELDAVEKIAECRTNELLHEMPAKGSITEEYFERCVEQWLDDLREGGHRYGPAAVEEAIESLVRPAVMSGVVGATGPRWRRTGS